MFYKTTRILARPNTGKNKIKNYKGGIPCFMRKGSPPKKGRKIASKNRLPYKLVTEITTEKKAFTYYMAAPVDIRLGDMDITKFPVKIGREGDYILPKLLNPDGSPANSRNHAVLSLIGGGLWIEDVSTNGTFSIGVGGKNRLTKDKKYPVSHGSVFIFADGKPIKIKIKKRKTETANADPATEQGTFSPIEAYIDAAASPALNKNGGQASATLQLQQGDNGTDGETVAAEDAPRHEAPEDAGFLNTEPAANGEDADDEKKGGRKKGRRKKDRQRPETKNRGKKSERYSAIEQRINHDGFYNIVREADYDDENKVWINALNYGKLKMAIIILVITYAGITAFLQLNI